jgi:hypothetical protein
MRISILVIHVVKLLLVASNVGVQFLNFLLSTLWYFLCD